MRKANLQRLKKYGSINTLGISRQLLNGNVSSHEMLSNVAKQSSS
ncbi:MAG: hypothetical protein ABF575_04815 [Liquorilactobacillus hordei]